MCVSVYVCLCIFLCVSALLMNAIRSCSVLFSFSLGSFVSDAADRSQTSAIYIDTSVRSTRTTGSTSASSARRRSIGRTVSAGTWNPDIRYIRGDLNSPTLRPSNKVCQVWWMVWTEATDLLTSWPLPWLCYLMCFGERERRGGVGRWGVGVEWCTLSVHLRVVWLFILLDHNSMITKMCSLI